MGETVTIQAVDGHDLSAYVAKPIGEPIAGLVVIVRHEHAKLARAKRA